MPLAEECPLSQGWERRIASKTAVAGVTGAAAGSVLAILRQAPAVRYSLGTGASVAFCVGCYAALLEGVRRARCADDPLNSLLAGGATAAALVGITQGSRPKATAAALYVGAAAGALHAADSYLGASDWLRPRPETHAASQAAESAGCADSDARTTPRACGLVQPRGSAAAQHGRGSPPGENAPPWWERWLPLRRLSDEEWAAYQRNKKEGFRQRVEAVKEGGLPLQLEKEHRRLTEQQGAGREP